MNIERAKEITLFLLRVVSGLLFLQAGGMKMFDWFGGVPAQFGGHPAFFSETGRIATWYGQAPRFTGSIPRREIRTRCAASSN